MMVYGEGDWDGGDGMGWEAGGRGDGTGGTMWGRG